MTGSGVRLPSHRSLAFDLPALAMLCQDLLETRRLPLDHGLSPSGMHHDSLKHIDTTRDNARCLSM